MPLRLSRRAALALGLAAIPLGAARALNATEQALVDRAVAYLDGLRSVKAHFTQSDQRGAVAEGDVWLARPGRARFQYDPPSSLLITCDGKTVTVTDSRLKTRQTFPVSASPLGLFLADHIRLDHGVRVTRVDRATGGAFSVTARDTRGIQSGEITIYFEADPIRLTGWAIIDAEARMTRVILGALAAVPEPSPDLFLPGVVPPPAG